MDFFPTPALIKGCAWSGTVAVQSLESLLRQYVNGMKRQTWLWLQLKGGMHCSYSSFPVNWIYTLYFLSMQSQVPCKVKCSAFDTFSLEEQKKPWFVINYYHDIQSKPVVDSFAVETKIQTWHTRWNLSSILWISLLIHLVPSIKSIWKGKTKLKRWLGKLRFELTNQICYGAIFYSFQSQSEVKQKAISWEKPLVLFLCLLMSKFSLFM